MNTGTSRSGSTSRVSLVHMVGSQAGLQDGGDGNRNSHHDQDIESDAKDENAHIRVHSTLGGDTFTTPDEVQTTGNKHTYHTTIAVLPGTLGPEAHRRPVGDLAPLQTPAAIQKRMRKVFNVEYSKAIIAQKPKAWTRNTAKLYGFLGVAFLSSCLNGYDATVIAGINAMNQYQDYFNMKTLGSMTGLIFMTYMLGNMVGSLISGPLCDSWGRRWGMFVGALVILLATTIQASSTTIERFVLGRFILGIGSAIFATAGPTYIAEMAHPAWRGVLTGLYNSFFFSGAIMASWIMWRTEKYESSMSWRLPIWLQATTAGLIFLLVLLCPETPRWLISHERNEEAVNVITRYFGEGNRKAPIVVLSYKEMVQEIFLEGSDKRWWDYSELWSTRAGRWRMVCVGGMAFFSQWSGNGAVNFYLPPLLDRLGITNEELQLLNLAAFYIVCFFIAILGALLVDRLGRRPMLIVGTGLFVIWWTVIAVLASFFAVEHDEDDTSPGNVSSEVDPVTTHGLHGSLATIAFIYLFGITHSFSYTPLQILYPVECLRYETRAKGMGVYNLLVHIASIFNTYGMGAIIEKLGWAFCFIFIGWDLVEFVAIWFFAVETRGRTLEELNRVFEAEWPPKQSLEMRVLDETLWTEWNDFEGENTVVEEGRGIAVGVENHSAGVESLEWPRVRGGEGNELADLGKGRSYGLV